MKSRGGKDSFDNCIPLCFNCHGDMRSVDHRHPKGRKYTESELKNHRDSWYANLAGQRSSAKVPIADDEVILDTKIRWSADAVLINRIGCPCVVAAVICRSPRPAKIRGLELRLRGFNPILDVQAGFGEDFGYKPPPKKHQRNDAFVVELIPLARPNAEHGFVLQRDDVVEFALPLHTPLLSKLDEFAGPRFTLHAEFFDGDFREVASGTTIKDHLLALRSIQGGRPSCLKVPIRFSLKVANAGLPSIGPVGKVNAKPIHFHSNRDDDSSPRIDAMISICRHLVDQSQRSGSFEVTVGMDAPITNEPISELKRRSFGIGLGERTFPVSLSELTSIVRLTGTQFTLSKMGSDKMKEWDHPRIRSLLGLSPSDQAIEEVLTCLELRCPPPYSANRAG